VYSGKLRITKDTVLGTDDSMRKESNIEPSGNLFRKILEGVKAPAPAYFGWDTNTSDGIVHKRC
jgi:hypothetical protein